MSDVAKSKELLKRYSIEMCIRDRGYSSSSYDGVRKMYDRS